MHRSIKHLLLLAISASVALGQRLGPTRLAMTDAISRQQESLFAQRASLKRQMGDATFGAFLGTTFYGTLPAPVYAVAPSACPPLDPDTREALISTAARSAAIDPDLLRAVMHRESGYRPCAVSGKGALGIMQLMPSTLAQFHVSDPWNPAQSIRAGASLLRDLLDRYQGDLRQTLAAYNAGAGRVDKSDPESYPEETKNYITGILSELGVSPQ
jgi:soluble lytic murein transglycosylase-like protein